MNNSNNIYDKPIMVDPPQGWKYTGPDGKTFPKLYHPSKEPGTMFEWLVREGYPQSEIDRLGSSFTCRFWYPE
jgi:hypothetical protein